MHLAGSAGSDRGGRGGGRGSDRKEAGCGEPAGKQMALIGRLRASVKKFFSRWLGYSAFPNIDSLPEPVFVYRPSVRSAAQESDCVSSDYWRSLRDEFLDVPRCAEGLGQLCWWKRRKWPERP